MPPTIPESDFEAMEDDYETSNIKKYVYDIKFDVVMKDGTKTIPGKASLLKALMTIKNAKRKTEKIDGIEANNEGLEFFRTCLGFRFHKYAKNGSPIYIEV